MAPLTAAAVAAERVQKRVNMVSKKAVAGTRARVRPSHLSSRTDGKTGPARMRGLFIPCTARVSGRSIGLLTQFKDPPLKSSTAGKPWGSLFARHQWRPLSRSDAAINSSPLRPPASIFALGSIAQTRHPWAIQLNVSMVTQPRTRSR